MKQFSTKGAGQSISALEIQLICGTFLKSQLVRTAVTTSNQSDKAV